MRTYRQLFGLGTSAFVAVILSSITYAGDPLSDSLLVERNSQADARCKLTVAAATPTRVGDIAKVEVRWCGEELQHQVLVYDTGGQLVSTAMCCDEYAKVELTLLPDRTGEIDLVVATSGFEPLDDREDFSIEIFQAISGHRIAAIWSESPPTFLNSDHLPGFSEIVFTRDIFGIRRYDAPVWPVVMNVRRGLVFIPLKEHHHVLHLSLSESRKILQRWEKICTFPEATPCPLDGSVKRLEAQISALEVLLGVSPAPH